MINLQLAAVCVTGFVNEQVSVGTTEAPGEKFMSQLSYVSPFL